MVMLATGSALVLASMYYALHMSERAFDGQRGAMAALIILFVLNGLGFYFINLGVDDLTASIYR